MATRWADQGEDSSSDEDDSKKRVVKSSKDKRYDLMKQNIKQLQNHKKIDDFANLIVDYETLVKSIDKLKTVIAEDGGPPAVFIKTITNLEIYVENMHAEKQKTGVKLTEKKARSFNTLRAKVRKGNKAWQEEVEKCKQNPGDYGEDVPDSESDSDSSGSSSEAPKKGKKGSKGKKAAASDSSSSSSSDSSSSGSSDSSSSSDSDSGSSVSDSDSDFGTGTDRSDDEGSDEEAVREKKMMRWLITEEKKQKEDNIKKQRDAGKAEKQDKAVKSKHTRPSKKNREEKPDKHGDLKEQEELTPEELQKKVTEIAQQRGRRGFDRAAYMENLRHLMSHGAKFGPKAQLYILSCMVSADFDNTGGAFAPMRIDMWNQALEKVTSMVPLLVQAHAGLKADGIDPMKDDDADDPQAFTRLQDLFVSFVEMLDDELYKALQFTADVYGLEYTEILGNSSRFLVLLKRVVKFFMESKQAQPLGVLSMRLMEHLYYKPDLLNRTVFEAIQHGVPEDEKPEWVWPTQSTVYTAELCRYVAATEMPELALRASMCQVYHLALHGFFSEARDIMHLGNLAELAETSDVRTQILNNRVVAQMGLCAFRLGKIYEAHSCLCALMQHNKARELLAQGVSFSKNMDKTPEQERAEKLRQLPYHMHINLDVLDSAHHITAMLLEIPNMAMQSIDPTNKTRTISRVLRRALETHDKQLFIGPPENAKEAVLAAAKALQRGEWQNACAALEDLKLWDHIDPGSTEAGQKVKEMVKDRIKTEALRTYLFAYLYIYDAFHLDQLVSMFELPPKTVHSIISKMMYREEIVAFWDESSKYVLVQHSEPSHLQRLALTLAERAAQAVENNERLVEQKTGVSAFKTGAAGPGGGGRWEPAGSRFGKAGGKGGKGSGKGKGKGKSALSLDGAARNRGWENARAGAQRGIGLPARGTAQRGWSTGPAKAVA